VTERKKWNFQPTYQTLMAFLMYLKNFKSDWPIQVEVSIKNTSSKHTNWLKWPSESFWAQANSPFVTNQPPSTCNEQRDYYDYTTIWTCVKVLMTCQLTYKVRETLFAQEQKESSSFHVNNGGQWQLSELCEKWGADNSLFYSVARDLFNNLWSHLFSYLCAHPSN